MLSSYADLSSKESKKILTHVSRFSFLLALMSCSMWTNSPLVDLAEAGWVQTLPSGTPLISLPMVLSVATSEHVERGEEGMVACHIGKLAEICSESRWMGKAALAGSVYHWRLEGERPG